MVFRINLLVAQSYYALLTAEIDFSCHKLCGSTINDALLPSVRKLAV